MVTLSLGSDERAVSQLLTRGYVLFCVRADEHDLSECRRLIALLRKLQTERAVAAAVILQLDSQTFPKACVIDSVSVYLHPRSLPPDIKQQILLADAVGAEFVCLARVASNDTILALKSCLAACASSAKILVSMDSTVASENLAAILSASDGLLISADDFAEAHDLGATDAKPAAIVKQCRASGTPVYVCTHSSP